MKCAQCSLMSTKLELYENLDKDFWNISGSSTAPGTVHLHLEVLLIKHGVLVPAEPSHRRRARQGCQRGIWRDKEFGGGNFMRLSSWTFIFLFSDFHERPEDMDVKISPSSLNSTGWRGPLLEPRHKKKSFRSSRRSSEDANLAWNEPRCQTKL